MGKTVALFDVDSKIPNFALMKLSTYYKQKGFSVALYRDMIQCQADLYFASVIFHNQKSAERIQWLRYIYGDRIEIGGSGIELKKRLPPEVELCFPDYSLYHHDKFAIGFLTRGCDRHCPFCLVHEKEGPKRIVAKFEDFMPKNQTNLLLLDDNILSFQESTGFLEEMIHRRYSVNFSQSLDISHFDEDTYHRLMRIDSRNARFTKRMYYFSCNTRAGMGEFTMKSELLKGLGKEAVTVIMMYGFNTHLSEEYEMLSMMKKIGLIPFMQEYQPIIGVPSRVPENYFDMDLDKMVGLKFSTNGQNREKYLRWLSGMYYKTYSRYYRPLIEKIYQYNNKNRLNWYLDRPKILSSPFESTHPCDHR